MSYRRKPVPSGIEKYAIADLGWIPDQSWNDEIRVFFQPDKPQKIQAQPLICLNMYACACLGVRFGLSLLFF